MKNREPTPRKKFVEGVTFKRLAGYSWDAMQLASTHDPEYAKYILKLERRLAILERQMERIGAPLYRAVGQILVQRVKRLPKPDYKLRETA